MDRTSVILQGIDKATARGVEIGPFYSPIAAKKNGWNTIVVDFKNTQELQLVANEHPSEDLRAMAGNIEEVDIVWKGEPIDQAVAGRFGQDHEMDYVIGSHTIEHMVDFLGFMKSASNLLKVGGVLALAVPDLRYEFDFFRSPSTLGQVLGVHRRKAERHAPEMLFDTMAYSVNVSGVGCWMPGTYMPEINLSSTLAHAWLCYQHDLPRTEYIDSHAWYFTPSSFQLLVWELWHLGLTDFTLKNISSAAHNNTGSEFIVQLVKRDRVAEAIAITPQAEVESHRKDLLLGMVAELAERAVNLGMATFKMHSGLRAVG